MRRRTSGTGPEACSCGAVEGRQGLGNLFQAVFAAGQPGGGLRCRPPSRGRRCVSDTYRLGGPGVPITRAACLF